MGDIINFKDLPSDKKLDVESLYKGPDRPLYEDIVEKLYDIMYSIGEKFFIKLEEFEENQGNCKKDDTFIRNFGEISLLYYSCKVMINVFETKIFTNNINILTGKELQFDNSGLSREAIKLMDKIQLQVKEYERRTGDKIIIDK